MDKKIRSLRDIPAREDSGFARRLGPGIDVHGPARGYLQTLDPLHEAEVSGLADGEDHGVGLDELPGLFRVGRVEAPVGIKNREHLPRKESGHLAVQVDHVQRAA